MISNTISDNSYRVSSSALLYVFTPMSDSYAFPVGLAYSNKWRLQLVAGRMTKQLSAAAAYIIHFQSCVMFAQDIFRRGQVSCRPNQKENIFVVFVAYLYTHTYRHTYM